MRPPSQPGSRDARILAGEVVKQHPDQCKLGIAYFDINSGAEAFEMLEGARGQWLNFYGRTLHDSQSVAGAPMLMEPTKPPGSHEKTGTHEKTGGHGSSTHTGTVGHPAPPPHPITHSRPDVGPAAGTEVEEVKVDYLTDTLLLDVAGGAHIPGRDTGLKEPGHVLLLDPQGNLVVLHELTDEEEIKNLLPKGPIGPEKIKKPPKNPKSKDKGDNLGTLMGSPTPPPKKSSYKKSG